MIEAPRNTILLGDAIDRLKELPPASVDCVITSPPFYMLRDYGEAGQIGLEADVDAWVNRLRVVFAEVARILVPTGSVWVDLGDSFSRHDRYGAPAKSLLLAPERLALALVSDGWRLRAKAVWAKTNPMPTSVRDRLATTYDVVYHFVRQSRYHFDLDAIRVPHLTGASRTDQSAAKRRPDWAGPLAGSNSGLSRFRPPGIPGHLLGKNPGDVWPLPSAHFKGGHFATFPEALVERPLLATCPFKVCTICGRPWRRSGGKTYVIGQRRPSGADPKVRKYASAWRVLHQPGIPAADCDCGGGGARPGLALDPFFGTGTVGVVAERLGRDWLGIELNPIYAALAWQRLGRGSPEARAA